MWVALVAMTLANSMILVDQTAVPLATPDVVRDLNADIDLGQWLLTANILPLAALMVFGGRLGDLLGLRRVFLIGSVIFLVSTALAGAAQDIVWMIAVRATQGVGAALMMPTAMAIVSAVFPDERRGTALGVLAGGSAFFAALGPVLGGALTSIDWRLVFWINVPIAAATIGFTLASVPKLAPSGDRQPIDYPGVVTFSIGIAALVFGLSQGRSAGLDQPGDPDPARRRRRRACRVRVDRGPGEGADAQLPAVPPPQLPRRQHQPGARRDGRARARLPAPLLPAPGGGRRSGGSKLPVPVALAYAPVPETIV